MIQKVEIQNFQSHKNSTLEFDPGVNIIIGTSDSGKTAVIRALKFVNWNRPSGDSIRSNWGGDTSVTIHTDQGSISRLKNKADSYIIETDKKLELKAFGLSVPEEVSKFLNLSEINLQSQLDAPFLLSASPGEVAQHFNKVARLDKIDRGISNINSWILQINGTIGTEAKKDKSATGLIRQIQDTESNLTDFANLPELEWDVEVLEALEHRLTQLQGDYNSVTRLHSTIIQIEAKIENTAVILGYEEDVNSILELTAELKKKKDLHAKLSRMYATIQQCENNIVKQNKTLSLESEVDSLQELLLDKKWLKKEKENLEYIGERIESAKNKLKKAEDSLYNLETEFHDNFPVGSYCPLCGSIKKKQMPEDNE